MTECLQRYNHRTCLRKSVMEGAAGPLPAHLQVAQLLHELPLLAAD